MALRLKTKWRTKGPKTPVERAGVVGVGIWKIAHEAFKRMGKDGFNFSSENQVSAFIIEFIAFLVQVTDRTVYGKTSEADRKAFINALGLHLARTFEISQTDLKGPGDYAPSFLATLNARLTEYAEFEYTPKGPGYKFIRYLGDQVAEIMGTNDNKWVLEHVMEIEAPEVVRLTQKLVSQVMGLSTN